jgi:hypothetical protein
MGCGRRAAFDHVIACHDQRLFPDPHVREGRVHHAANVLETRQTRRQRHAKVVPEARIKQMIDAVHVVLVLEDSRELADDVGGSLLHVHSWVDARTGGVIASLDFRRGRIVTGNRHGWIECATDVVERARGGDALAVEQLLASIQNPVYALALRMLADPEGARDATQDILLRVSRALPQFRKESTVSTWGVCIGTRTVS